MKMLSFGDLKPLKGIKFSRQHIHRLVRLGRFPRPVKIGENTNSWVESEIDNWIAGRVKQRDETPATVAA